MATHPSIKSHEKYKEEEILIEDSPATQAVLRKFILRHNVIEYVCESCGNKGEWNNKKLVLHLDHKNGNNKDNRIENLRYLCPNCHSQTETYCGKNKGKGSVN